MKSNLTELFNQYFSKNKHGIIDVNDMTDKVMKDIVFYRKLSRKELERFYIRTRLESLLNANKCYAYKKNTFISVEAADLERLKNMDENFVKEIEGREHTLEEIRKHEKQLENQLEMVMEGSKCVGFREVITIDKLLKSSRKDV